MDVSCVIPCAASQPVKAFDVNSEPLSDRKILTGQPVMRCDQADTFMKLDCCVAESRDGRNLTILNRVVASMYRV